MIDPVFLFTRFDGRIARFDFWCGLAALASVFGAIGFLAIFLPPMARDFVAGACYAGCLYPLAALMSKRLQDRGKAIAYLLIMPGVPVAASLYGLFMRPANADPVAVALSGLYVLTACWAAVELGLMPGKPGANEFGDDPLAISRPAG